MKKYLVVWECDLGVLQSAVKTDKDPHDIWELEWLEMAAEAEEIEPSNHYTLYLVIDYPEKYYN